MSVYVYDVHLHYMYTVYVANTIYNIWQVYEVLFHLLGVNEAEL